MAAQFFFDSAAKSDPEQEGTEMPAGYWSENVGGLELDSLATTRLMPWMCMFLGL